MAYNPPKSSQNEFIKWLGSMQQLPTGRALNKGNIMPSSDQGIYNRWASEKSRYDSEYKSNKAKARIKALVDKARKDLVKTPPKPKAAPTPKPKPKASVPPQAPKPVPKSTPAYPVNRRKNTPIYGYPKGNR